MARNDLTEQFAALPREVQEQLIRVSRTAAGMSEDEKRYAVAFFGGMTLQAANGPDDGVESGQIASACMRLVNEVHRLAGEPPKVVL